MLLISVAATAASRYFQLSSFIITHTLCCLLYKLHTVALLNMFKVLLNIVSTLVVTFHLLLQRT